MKYALINTDKVTTVERYLPQNYQATPLGTFTLVFGNDHLGWTLEDYVLPRLASGLYFPVPKDDAYVEYHDAVFALIDAQEGPYGLYPLDEVWVYTQADWEASTNLMLLEQTPAEGYEPWDEDSVAEEVDRDLDRQAAKGLPTIIDPGFDYQAAADYANTKLRAAGLLTEEV